MKAKFYLLFLGVSVIMLSSCKVSTWLTPPYTTVSKITQLKAGMSLSKVNETLGIEPYDVYNIQDDGSTILLYNYRLKKKKMTYNPNDVNATHSESSQTEGSIWFDEPQKIYILFVDDKVKSLITDNGRLDAEYVLVANNNIQVINKQQLNGIKKQESDNYYVLECGANGGLKPLKLDKVTTDDKAISLPEKVQPKADNSLMPFTKKKK